MSTPDVLLEALDRFAATGAEFGGFLANHGPMAVEAMTVLEAGDAVPSWVDQYVGVLDDAPMLGRAVDHENWRNWLGRHTAVGDWTAFFLRQAGEEDWRGLLRTWWPRLIPGLAASATHGVIRTAHAVRSLSSAGPAPAPVLVGELARGLALWAARYQELPIHRAGPGTRDAVTALSRLPRLPHDVPPRGDGVVGRLLSLDAVPDLSHSIGQWRHPEPADAGLTELIAAAARVVAWREDAPIPMCHAVTAPAAIRLVLPLLDEEQQRVSVQAAWQVVGALVAAYAVPRQDTESLSTPRSDEATRRLIDRLPQAAVEHGDEHVIKLTEAALREYAVSADPTLLVAADRFRARMRS